MSVVVEGEDDESFLFTRNESSVRYEIDQKYAEVYSMKKCSVVYSNWSRVLKFVHKFKRMKIQDIRPEEFNIQDIIISVRVDLISYSPYDCMSECGNL